METLTKTNTVEIRCPGEFFVNQFDEETKGYKKVLRRCGKFLCVVYFSASNGNGTKIGLNIKCPRCKEQFERIEVV